MASRPAEEDTRRDLLPSCCTAPLEARVLGGRHVPLLCTCLVLLFDYSKVCSTVMMFFIPIFVFLNYDIFTPNIFVFGAEEESLSMLHFVI